MKVLVITVVAMLVTAMVYTVAVGAVVGGSPGVAAAWFSVGLVDSVCGVFIGYAVDRYQRERGVRPSRESSVA